MSKQRVEMYEEILPDGRCKYRMPYIDLMTNKRKTVSLIMDKASSSNYKIAKRYLEDRIEEIMEKVGSSDTTLDRLICLYLADKGRTLKKSTLKRNKATLKRLEAWLGEDTLVNKLTVPYVRSTILEHSEENHTFNEYLTRFKSLLSWAYMNDYLEDRKIIDKLQPLPDNKKLRIQDKYLEREELQKLLDASENVPHWHYVIHFMALSGLRVGEVIALLDQDIDSEYIHVTKTYQVTTGEIDTPKTQESIRDIFIRDELKLLIRDIRKWMREYTFSKGIRTDLFICSIQGSHLQYYAFNKYLSELSQRVLGRKITTHALRHTAASLLIADGVPLEVVSRMLGHESSDITREIYFHITKTLRDADNAALKNAKVL